jgi:ABC-type lipoprotein export system ATPase subunit
MTSEINLNCQVGSRWFRCDFHVHSPKSDDYPSKTDTPEMWLRAAIDVGLDCVAITDHNSGEWIDELKTTLQKMKENEEINLVLFPGVEITVQGGCHLLVLFDPSENRDHVKSFLTEAGIPNSKQGIIDEQANDVIDVLDAAQNHQGICILAHANDTKGFLLHDSGKHKINVITNQLLHGIEINDFYNCSCYKKVRDSGDSAQIDEAYTLYNETLSTLDEYKRKRVSALAQVQFSDNPDLGGHSLNGIGERSTWIKMSYPDKEGLRLALHDGPMCCECYDETMPNRNEYSHPIIKSIAIEEAYVTGLREPLMVSFSPWLTTIIGGRGSGKSTVIECLRIGLCKEVELKQFGINSQLLSAFQDFKKCHDKNTGSGALRPETKISIEYLKDSFLYEINWAAEVDAISINQILSDGSKNVTTGDVCQRFPVNIYSQKQIFEIARKPAALLNIIDQSPTVNIHEWKRQWTENTSEFMALRAKSRELHINNNDIEIIKGELSDVNNKISLLENDDNKQTRLAWQRATKQQEELSTSLKEIEDKAQHIEEVVPQLALSNLTPTNWDNDGGEKEIISAQTVASNELYKIQSNIEKFAENVKTIASDFNKSIIDSGWQVDFDSIKKKYDDLVSTLEEQGIPNAGEYEILLNRRKELETRISQIMVNVDELVKIDQQAEILRNDLFEKRKELTINRQNFIHDLANHLETVKIEIEPFGDMESLEKELRNLIQAQSEFESTLTPDIGRLNGESTEARPTNLLEGIYATSVSMEQREVEIIKIQDLFLDINQERKIGELNGHFENKIRAQQPEIIDRILLTFPEDRTIISYLDQSKSNKWKSISSGSPGQKTAAILTFLLAYGNEPLIVDQPEDDLDNSLIYNLVVEQIKENKMRRQLIIVTHNPNIPVNGDSELIVVMEPMSSGGFAVGYMGGLQETQIRNKICDIMEGGEVAFKKRYERIIGIE